MSGKRTQILKRYARLLSHDPNQFGRHFRAVKSWWKTLTIPQRGEWRKHIESVLKSKGIPT